MLRHRTLTLAAGLLVCAVAAGSAESQATEVTPQQEIEELRKRVEQLEQVGKAPGKVTPGTKGVDIRIDGRLFAGVFGSGRALSFAHPSLDIPDAKLRFTFTPTRDVVVVNRLSTSRAGASLGFDYFYVDLANWAGLFPGHTLRIGKHKIDIGQETFTDNPVESNLITNAVSHVSGYDEGINLRGPILHGPRPVTYSVELLNNTRGFSPADGLAWGAKIGWAATPQLYLSGSFFNGSRLSGDTDFSVAEMSSAPPSATVWRRVLWEGDVRYGHGPEGVRSVVGNAAGVPWQLAAAYGRFSDHAYGAADRKGSYWYAEALNNLTPTLYAAARYSEVELDDGVLAKLGNSPVAVSRYRRLGIGVGYRLSLLTHVKAEYTINSTKGGGSSPGLNQVAVGIATKF